MQLADTVVVGDKGKGPEVVTTGCPKTWDKISYTLNVRE